MKNVLRWINENNHRMRIGGGVMFVLALFFCVLWLFGYNKFDSAAYIVQLLSSLFLALPIIAKYYLNIKPIKDMSFNEILSFIKSTSPRDSWYIVKRSYLTEAFLKDDPRLRFRICYLEEGMQRENFQEEWANRHPDPSATGYWCDLFYNGDFLDRIILVAVDGGRATLPMPDIDTKVIDPYHYQVASIFDESGTLDEYISRSKLKRPEKNTLENNAG